MPDLDILIEMADYCDIDLRELLDGERKSEKINVLFIVEVIAFSVYHILVYTGLSDTYAEGKLAAIMLGLSYGIMTVGVLFTIVLISVHGSGLIAGYNTAPKEKQEKYDEKKLCKTVGAGMAIISLLILIMGVFMNVLPAFFAYISLGIIMVDVVVIIFLGNTICKK